MREQDKNGISRRGLLGATAGGAALLGGVGISRGTLLGGAAAVGATGATATAAAAQTVGEGGLKFHLAPASWTSITASGRRARPASCGSWACPRCAR